MPDDWGLIAADALVGSTLAICGAIAWRSRRQSLVGPIMLLGSLFWFAGNLTGAAALLHRGPLVHLHISYPTGRLRRPLAVVTVGTAYVAAAVESWARNPWLTLTVAGLVILAALDVFARTAGPARKAAGPALGAALAFAAVLAVSSANQLRDWQIDLAVSYLYDAVVAMLVIVLLVDLRRAKWTDATLADLVTTLGEKSDGTGLVGEVRRALADPSAELGYWVPDRNGYVTEAGQPMDPGASGGREVTLIEDRGQPLAVLVHDAAAIEDPRLLTGVASAARLAVANARMNAEVRARMEELAASRRRIVEAGDAQRRRLANDLAVGAERRLDEVAGILAMTDAETPDASLGAILQEVEETRADLREFAQGIRPSALTTGGLALALPALAARSPAPVDLRVDVGRMAPAVEAAVYFFCSEALANVAKHARATRVAVQVIAKEGDVVARVSDDGVGGADPGGSGLRGLADRIEALGGTMTVAGRAGRGTMLDARVPIPGEEMP